MLARNWCKACVNWQADDVVKTTTEYDIREHHVWAMGKNDWIALILCSVLVGLGIGREVHNNHLCELALRAQSGERLAPTDVRRGVREGDLRSLPNLHQLPLLYLTAVRRYVFLPALVSTVAFLVVMKGGDALSVCFNTVAMLFLVDMPFTAYNYGLSDRTKAILRESECFHLSASEVDEISTSKTLHAALVVVGVTVAVASSYHGEWAGIFGVPFLVFYLGGMFEVLIDSKNSDTRSARAGRVTLQALLGFVSCAIIFAFSAM